MNYILRNLKKINYKIVFFLEKLWKRYIASVITHADDSHGSKAFSSVCVSVCLSVCLCVCLCDKTKTAETTITKLVTGVVHHESSPTN